MPAEDKSRLPTNVRPIHYSLIIRTDLETSSFQGRAEIDLDLLAETSALTFHAAEPVKVTKVALATAEGPEPASSIDVNPDLQRVTATFDRPLKQGQLVRVGIEWHALLNVSMGGYFKSTYSHEGTPGVYALTMFAPCNARKAFPSWDEPALKATFDLALISRARTISLSNMDPLLTTPCSGAFPPSPLFHTTEAITPEGEWTITRFPTTPNMSTYLVAFSNGNFRAVESSYTSPLMGRIVPSRIYVTPDNVSQANLALDVQTQVMPLYETLFDVAYPLPKLDTLVASNFLGATENWGLIVGADSTYLYEKGKSGAASEKMLAGTSAHEIAHQWFGNIVTLQWWDDLWLNEAFATFVSEYIMLEKIRPGWHPQSEFVNKHHSHAMKLDSLRSSHPIVMPCPNEGVIAQLLDTISYSKGASVLRMLSIMLGEDVFLRGVSTYLKKHLYGNATTEDLWSAISDVSGVNVNIMMASWTEKTGYPIIYCSQEEDVLHVTQHRFLSSGDVTSDEDTTLWHVPLNIKTIGPQEEVTVDKTAVLNARAGTFAIPSEIKLLKLNADAAGFYRVKYLPKHLDRLGDEAGKENSALSSIDRMSLVQDVIALAKSGAASVSEALNLVAKLRHDPDYLVWSEISDGLADIADTWWEQDKDVLDGLNRFRRSLFGPLVEKLSFEFAPEDGADLIQWRLCAITQAAAAGDEKTLKEIQSRFALSMNEGDRTAISSNLQDCIYQYAVRYGAEWEYEKVLEIYRNPAIPSQKQAAMFALCQAQLPALQKRNFDMLSSSEIGENDYLPMFRGLKANPAVRRELWAYLKINYEALLDMFQDKMFLGFRIIQASFDFFSTDDDLRAVDDFFADKDTSTYEMAFRQGLETVRIRTAWLKRDGDNLRVWLRDHRYLDESKGLESEHRLI